ncbi:MAG: class I SAM-dependent methyltransferase [Flavobacteriales bacterium]|nr:class I SAM-dependent methyltransferase [Flavobacteriales bacterium]MDG2245602.1 class I SAM-dependent methyltransferase [Flavobacteriales bacterium]
MNVVLCVVFRAIQYGKYILHSRGIHGAHSAFIFDLFEHVFDEGIVFYSFEAIENERARLKGSNEVIDVLDLGAGSKFQSSSQRKISQIARTALKRPKYARLLFRLCNHLNYHNVLELGTSLGVTTAYLSHAVSSGSVYSIEGSKSIWEKAVEVGNNLNLRNVHYLNGAFSEVVPSILEKKTFDLIFIDGHHQGDALIEYVEMVQDDLNPDGCLVVDDINWSPDMQEAWQKLVQSPTFSLSLDFFEMGLLFKKEGMVKQHHVIKY